MENGCHYQPWRRHSKRPCSTSPPQSTTTIKYELQNIKYNSGEKIYLYSDGYQDQFGGPKGKKFLTKKFRELIHEISSDSMSNQKQRLNEEFVKWKNKEDQTDDILVIGLEL